MVFQQQLSQLADFPNDFRLEVLDCVHSKRELCSSMVTSKVTDDTMAFAARDKRTLVWTPSSERIASTNLYAFMSFVRKRLGIPLSDYNDVYDFSVDRMDDFWSSVWDFAGVIGQKGRGPFLVEGATMREAVWFPEARLNLAENLLRGSDSETVLVFRDEAGSRRSFNRGEVRQRVFAAMAALRAEGVQAGDRVAAYLGNTPEAAIAALAALGVGAVWTICPPELGEEAVLERLGQLEPAVLFVGTTSTYKGQLHEVLGKGLRVARGLSCLKRVVVVSTGEMRGFVPAENGCVAWDAWLDGRCPDLRFERFPFSHPAFILFSSGSTGKPKPILHGSGGVLMRNIVDQSLHRDVKSGDRVFWVTSSGWMMWNVLLLSLQAGAAIVQYEGSPLYPDADSLFRVVEEEGVTLFGPPAPLVTEWRKSKVRPKGKFGLSKLRTMVAGGALLREENYTYAYRDIKSDFHFCSSSGGTELMSVLASENPIGACFAGWIQARALGMRVEIFDDSGESVVGEPGELVCTGPFPSMPLGSFGEMDDVTLLDKYFSKFPDVWRHGDTAELSQSGEIKIYGRSDATMKVNGIRIGPAEIYNELEGVSAVRRSVVVEKQSRDGSHMVLFVELANSDLLTDELSSLIRERLRTNVSPRHVPRVILQVQDWPVTSTGKISESAVHDAVNGMPVRAIKALVNPEVLADFEGRPGGEDQ